MSNFSKTGCIRAGGSRAGGSRQAGGRQPGFKRFPCEGAPLRICANPVRKSIDQPSVYASTELVSKCLTRFVAFLTVSLDRLGLKRFGWSWRATGVN